MRSQRSARGFTLIEILVGVGIGLIGVIVMFRMVALWDTHTRSATSGSDAQVSGTLAMFNLERDIKQAGMGIGNADAPFLGCGVTAQLNGTPRNFTMLPVQIVPGAGGAPDRIQVLYGDSSFFGGNASAPDSSLPGFVQGRDLAFNGSTATTKTLERRGMFRMGDLAIVAGNETAVPGSAACQLIEITDTSDPDNRTVAHLDTTYVSFYGPAASGVFNPPGGTGGTFSAGRIYNLGPRPQLNVWEISANGALTRSDFIHNGPANDVAERVVNLKAEYGIDTDNDRIVDTWTATPAVPVNWTTVLAIRVAVVVRSKQFEKSIDPSTNAAFAVTPDLAGDDRTPCWAGCDAAHKFVMTSIDGAADTFDNVTANPNNWRFYRYRVYERVIPLRNLLWGTAP